MMHEGYRGAIGRDRSLGKRLTWTERCDHPPGLIHAIDRRPEAHSRLDHLAGVTRVCVGPAPRVRPGLELLAHFLASREAAGINEHAVARLHAELTAIAHHDHAIHAIIVDDEIYDGRARPDRQFLAQCD